MEAALMINEARPIPNPALEHAFEKWNGMVFRTAYRITGNAADAEDALQTVFMRLAGRTSAEMANPESYLRRAAVNAALDIVRARTTNATVPLDDSHTAASCSELKEVRDALRRALTKLNPKWSEMFALRFFEGYTNPEIAKLLGMSQVLVAVTLHRARKQLQNDIRSYMGGR